MDLVGGLARRHPVARVKQNSNEPSSYNSSFDIPRTWKSINCSKRWNGNGEQGFLLQLNPATIASISVIKDASAAVYGVKAANSVILVKTKKRHQESELRLIAAILG